MASNSIKQKRMLTFSKTRMAGNSDFIILRPNIEARVAVNILVELGAHSDRAAWILVGGRSSRMGVDKARAESAGRGLALRIADQAAKVCGTVSLVGEPSKYADLGLPVIPDNSPGEGPLAGIEAALAATSCKANLIVACDMPAVGENLLEELFAAGGDCALPLHANGDIEPLCAVYQKRCHPVVRAALSAGVRSVTRFLREDGGSKFELRYVRVSDSAEFANLNTPEDWRRYHNG